MSNSEETGWSDVCDAAAKMFSVWAMGDELEWAEEAWGHLYAAGLASDGMILGDTAAKLRLVALARIYEEFSGVAWDENPETPLDDLAADLDIDGVALGILAADADADALEEAADDYELRDAALRVVTDSQRREIFECLKAAYGDEVRLYTRMWHTRAPELVEDDENESEEFEPTHTNSAALYYVMSGFRCG